MREWEDCQGSGIQVEGALMARSGMERLSISLGLGADFKHGGIVPGVGVICL